MKEYEECSDGTACCDGTTCFKKDQFYSQCLKSSSGCPSNKPNWACHSSSSKPSPPSSPSLRPGACSMQYIQCGGKGWTGATTCCGESLPGGAITTCYKQHEHYSQCLTSCPSGWDCAAAAPTVATGSFGGSTVAAIGLAAGVLPLGLTGYMYRRRLSGVVRRLSRRSSGAPTTPNGGDNHVEISTSSTANAAAPTTPNDLVSNLV